MNSQSADTRIADHYLCIVDWYNNKPSRYRAYFNVPLQQQLLIDEGDFEKLYHTELWGAKCTRRTYENILPVQRLVCRFVKGKYQVKGQKDKLNVVIPLRRMFI